MEPAGVEQSFKPVTVASEKQLGASYFVAAGHEENPSEDHREKCSKLEQISLSLPDEL